MTSLINPQVLMASANATSMIRANGSVTTATTTELIAKKGANVRIGLISVILCNTGSTNNVLVTLKSESNSIAYIYVPTETTAIASFGVEAPLWLNANEDLDWTTDAASTTMYITVHGIIGGDLSVTTA